MRLLVRMSLHSESDQPIDKHWIVLAACLPQLRVHADGGEARHRVDLVQEQLTSRAIQQKVDARESGAVNRTERAHCLALNLAHHRCVEHRGNLESRSGVDVLGFVVVELAGRKDLAGDRRLWITIAQYGALDLAGVRDRTLDDDASIELRGMFDRRTQLGPAGYLGNTEAGA